jgi:hypothetical protein
LRVLACVLGSGQLNHHLLSLHALAVVSHAASACPLLGVAGHPTGP